MIAKSDAHAPALTATFWTVVVLLVVPLWTSPWLPLVDFTNHLARCWILARYDSVAVFQHAYTVVRTPMSNMLMDATVAPLMRRVDAVTAGRIFMTVIVVIYALGCWWIAGAVRNRSWFTLIPLFFVFNSTLYMGFANYVISIALLLVLIAVWLRPGEIAALPRVAAAAALGLAVYLAHPGGFFCLGITALFLLAVCWNKERAFNRTLIGHGIEYGAAVLPGMMLYIAFPPGSGVREPMRWGSLKLKAIHSCGLFLGYNYLFDATIAVVLLAAIVAALWMYRPQLEFRLLGLGAIFALCFLVFPSFVYSGSDADTRFLVPAAALLPLGVRMRPTRRPAPAVLLVLVCLAAKLGAMTYYWHSSGAIAAEQIPVLSAVERNSSVCPLIWMPAEAQQAKREAYLINWPTSAVFLRDAIVPTTFALAGQHTIQARQAFLYSSEARWPLNSGGFEINQRTDLDVDYLLKTYEYVYAWRMPESLRAAMAQRARVVAWSGYGTLYRRLQ